MSQIAVINPILYTSETNQIPKIISIKDTMIYTMCLGFKRLGHSVILLAAEDYRPEREETYDFEIIWMKTIWHRIFLPRCFPYMPQLRGFLRKHKFDIIISSEVFGTWSYTAARLYPDKTLIWHELAKHNNIMHQLPSKVWYHLIARFFMRKAAVIPRSEAAAEFIGRFMPNVFDSCIEHGVDLQKYPQQLWKEKKKQFVVVSQFIERKQIDRTLQQFRDFIRKGHGDFRLYLIGQGELEMQLKALAARYHMEENVIFCGQLPHKDLFPIVAQSMALLVSTVKDNNMVSIAESIAAGTPVVTTSIPYNAVYVEREQLGIVSDDWNAETLEEVWRKNNFYTEKCVAYRKKLSNEYCAKGFIDAMSFYRHDRERE
ncbi:MAG: glycosyltransferase [Ruminococcus sp.]|nr:glycosyltransferase [Ruminococcus sp.]